MTRKPYHHRRYPALFATNNSQHALITAFSGLVLLAVLLVCIPIQVIAQEQAVVPAAGNGANVKPLTAVENLASIQQSLESKRKTLRELREQLKLVEDAADRQALEQKIEQLNKDIVNLQLAFEHIALGGLNLSVLTDQPDEQIDWRVELEQVSRPLISTLKELTAKPRQIDSLRRESARYEDQLIVIEKSIESIRGYQQQALPPPAAEPINQLLIDWEQRRDDVQRAQEITHYKLASLKKESTAWYISAGTALREFLSGRGLTLLLATLVSIVIWLIFRGLITAYWRWLYRSKKDSGILRAPLVLYSFKLATATTIVIGILLVFYIRGDVLFLTLALLALAGVALSLRQTLPRYSAEIRLLLGIGPVREKERLVLDGISYAVESLGVYSVLKNPELEGVVRLPLHDMNAMASRPASREPWFPCAPEEFVILADGSFGKVIRQTIEIVELLIRDSKVQIRTSEFISQNVRNLSREGFGIACTFGVDYQHQTACLDTIPQQFRKAIVSRFKQAGMKDDIEDLLVEFKEAGASSLDYQIYMILKGSAAKAYFKAQRMIQQACVDTCNRNGWIIPFTQITVHSGGETGGRGKQTDETAGALTQVASAASTHPV